MAIGTLINAGIDLFFHASEAIKRVSIIMELETNTSNDLLATQQYYVSECRVEVSEFTK